MGGELCSERQNDRLRPLLAPQVEPDVRVRPKRGVRACALSPRSNGRLKVRDGEGKLALSVYGQCQPTWACPFADWVLQDTKTQLHRDATT